MSCNCERIKDQLVDALYQELDPPEREAFQAHIASCESCAEEYESLRRTLETMDRRERAASPGPAYWEELLSKIQARAADAPRLSFDWGWALRIAAGLAILAAGIAIGRLSLAPDPGGDPARLAETKPSPAPTERQMLQQRVSDYVSRSQSLLVGLANFDTEAEDALDFDMRPQRRVSQNLLSEASYLRSQLDESANRDLLELISDLESILRQIANMEARHDLEGIEVIQSGVDSSGILFKINLENIRPTPVKTVEEDAA